MQPTENPLHRGWRMRRNERRRMWWRFRLICKPVTSLLESWTCSVNLASQICSLCCCVAEWLLTVKYIYIESVVLDSRFYYYYKFSFQMKRLFVVLDFVKFTLPPKDATYSPMWHIYMFFFPFATHYLNDVSYTPKNAEHLQSVPFFSFCAVSLKLHLSADVFSHVVRFPTTADDNHSSVSVTMQLCGLTKVKLTLENHSVFLKGSWNTGKPLHTAVSTNMKVMMRISKNALSLVGRCSHKLRLN